MIGTDQAAADTIVAAFRAASGVEALDKGKVDEFAELAISATSKFFPGALFAWPRSDKCTVYYAVAESSAQWRRLRPLLLAFVGLVTLKEPPLETVHAPASTSNPLRDRRLWRLTGGSALLTFVQGSILGFTVLFLHIERGFSASGAAGSRVAIDRLVVLGLKAHAPKVASKHNSNKAKAIAALTSVATINVDKAAWAQSIEQADKAILLKDSNAQAHLWRADSTRHLVVIQPQKMPVGSVSISSRITSTGWRLSKSKYRNHLLLRSAQ